MKVSCLQSDLIKGLNIVSKAVPTRTTMSILESILIDASTGDVRLTSNDMEIGIETIVPGKIEERGKVAIEAKILVDIIRNLPDNEVTIESDELFTTNISCEKAHFRVSGKNGEDFPYIPVIPRNDPIIVSQFTLRESIRQTIFSTAEKDPNNIMTGELFEIKNNIMTFSSLDGHRISVRNVELKDTYSDQKKVIIPGKTLNEISKILTGSAEDMVNIFITDNHIIFDYDKTTVVSRLIEGEFFDVGKMMSDDYETKFSISKKELIESIGRATLFFNDNDKKPIVLDINEQILDMRINSLSGNFEEQIVVAKEGKNIKIAFNPKFLMDVLRVIDDERISIYMLSSKSPCFIKDDEGKYVYLILPVNFNG